MCLNLLSLLFTQLSCLSATGSPKNQKKRIFLKFNVFHKKERRSKDSSKEREWNSLDDFGSAYEVESAGNDSQYKPLLNILRSISPDAAKKLKPRLLGVSMPITLLISAIGSVVHLY